MKPNKKRFFVKASVIVLETEEYPKEYPEVFARDREEARRQLLAEFNDGNGTSKLVIHEITELC